MKNTNLLLALMFLSTMGCGESKNTLTLLTSEKELPRTHNYLSQKTITDAPTLRFASYNLMASRLAPTYYLGESVKVLNADIIGLQEVDSMTQRSLSNQQISGAVPINQAQYLAGILGMHYKFTPAIEFDGGEYGTAILSRFPIESTEIFPLTNIDNREERIVAVHYINYPEINIPLGIVVTHLDPETDNALRFLQTREILNIVEGVAEKAVPVLIGDLNLQPITPEHEVLLQRFNDLFMFENTDTYPSWNPERRIDYIMTYKAQKWDVKGKLIPEPVTPNIDWGATSDHLPVIVDMSLQEI